MQQHCRELTSFIPHHARALMPSGLDLTETFESRSAISVTTKNTLSARGMSSAV